MILFLFFVIIKLRNNRFRIFNCQRTKTMRYSSLLALCAFMLCLNVPEVRGEILTVHTDDIMTHTALLPKPVASDNTFSLAATWWLPDWQSGQGSRGSEDMGGGDIDGNCEENYGMHTPSNIDSRYICSKYNYNVTSSLKCHVNCRCKDEYQYTSSNCSGNYTATGTSCEGKYNQCVCKAEFQYNSSNCSGDYQVSGTSCAGNYNACVCKSEFKYNSSNCNGSYQVSGSACNGNYNACVCKPEFKYNSSNCSGEYEVSGTSCGGYYNACTIRPDCAVTSKNCDYGCAATNSCGKCTECKTNPDCSATAVSCTYGCASTNSCGKCTSCKDNPDCSATAVSCDYGCASTNSCGICTGCKSPVGAILYSDGTISHSVIAGKTPVGIVAYVNGSTGFAVALTESKEKWSNRSGNVSCLGDMDSGAASADMNGRVNTQCLVSDNLVHPAASYCNWFSAVSSGKGSSGWYLPAAGELKAMSYSYGAIDLGLQKLSKTQIPSYYYYWSSSEYSYTDGYSAWVVRPSDGGMTYTNKDNSTPVRCVLAL